MSRFDSYFLMKAEDAIDYVKVKAPQFPWDESSMQCREIGDGNLNYVFRVWDDKGNSIIIKQAGSAARISKDMHISTDRNRVESEILILEGTLAEGFVPKIYFFDTVMSACGEEDLTGHEIMRTCMLRHEIFPKFAEDISTFMANTLMGTTDVVMDHKRKKELQRKFISPELCEITEDLVYTEPYNNCQNRNNIFAPNAEFLKKELYDDEELRLEVAKLKMEFMCNAQAMLHGDLHTGSVFITQDSTMVIDPEFGFYGPIGYDIGNVIANMIFAWCNGEAEIKDPAERKEFCGWVEQVVVEVIDKTMDKMKRYYEENVTDVMAKSKGYREYYLGTILADTAGVTGLELNRRTVGMANVKDLTTISDEKKRARAEKICVLSGKRYIKERADMKCGADFLKVFKDVASSVEL